MYVFGRDNFTLPSDTLKAISYNFQFLAMNLSGSSQRSYFINVFVEKPVIKNHMEQEKFQ